MLKEISNHHANGRLIDALNLAQNLSLAVPGDINAIQIVSILRQEILLSQSRDLLNGMVKDIQRTSHTTHQTLIRDLQKDERYADPKRLERYGFSVASQNEEDGMLVEVFNRIGEGNRTFFEFGVGNGLQNNTYFFLLAGWLGWWIEINQPKVKFMRHIFSAAINEGRLVIDDTLIDRDNIEAVTKKLNIPNEIDLLSIDIDGNDYHVFKAMNRVRPRVIVLEYNGLYPPPLQMVGAYDANYVYADNTYIGASLQSLTELAEEKGYQLVGCNITGLNCIFVRKDLAAGKFSEPATPLHLYNTPRHQLAWGGAFSVGPKPNFGPLHTEA